MMNKALTSVEDAFAVYLTCYSHQPLMSKQYLDTIKIESNNYDETV